MLNNASLLALLMLAGQPAAGGPPRYGAHQCGVSVASPHPLTLTSRTMASRPATLHSYDGKADGTEYRLFCVSDVLVEGPSDDLFATYREGFLDHDPRRLIAERPLTLGDLVGREIHAGTPGGEQSRVRVYIVPAKVFGVIVTGREPAVTSEAATEFLNSLRVEP